LATDFPPIGQSSLVTTAIPMRSSGGRFSPVYRVTRDNVQVGIFPSAAKARAFVKAAASCSHRWEGRDGGTDYRCSRCGIWFSYDQAGTVA
jgi:hypothetical protein